MIKKLTKHDLRKIGVYDYIIVGKTEYEHTVTHLLPYTTGCTVTNEFPTYLKDYKDYYTKRGFWWQLKEEYRWNRPSYTITVRNARYDVELTPIGVEHVRKRYEAHKRLMEEFQKLLGE